MVIREGKHVDAKGRIYLPGLHNWDYVGFDHIQFWEFKLLCGVLICFAVFSAEVIHGGSFE